MADPETLNWVALNLVKGVGCVISRRLAERFGGPGRVFDASINQLCEVPGVGKALADAVKSRYTFGPAEEELSRAKKGGVDIVTIMDERYPSQLKQIHDPPTCLYVKGNIIPEDRASVAIVGSRTATPYGRQVTARIASELARKGDTVVSGGARGIDTEAHSGALKAGGRTFCILGCGMDTAYPPENRPLFTEVVGSGAVITEFPFGTPPEGQNFPRRNRIISGLSLGVIVVEAAGDSGSLITASLALEQGREVYAVPGNIASPMSRGTNDLIRNGAKLIEGASDVMQDLFPHLQHIVESAGRDEDVSGKDAVPVPRPKLEPNEAMLYEHIGFDPVHIDEIASRSGLPASTALSVLLGMELSGAVKQIPGMRFIRSL
jgi:DNA processing protein